jgi:hypothetical protein
MLKAPLILRATELGVYMRHYAFVSVADVFRALPHRIDDGFVYTTDTLIYFF